MITFLALRFSLPEMAKTDTGMPTAPFVFPYALMTIRMFELNKPLLAILILGQFPAYGVILGRAWVRNAITAASWRLALLHILLGSTCALLYSLDR